MEKCSTLVSSTGRRPNCWLGRPYVGSGNAARTAVCIMRAAVVLV